VRAGHEAGADEVRVALVVAIADNGIIGRGGALPWHLPDDLRHFRAVTLGKAVLMGRRTFESIGGALPGRRNLVMSRDARAHARAGANAQAVATLEYVDGVAAACARVASTAAGAELCVIGGAQIYALALPRAARIYLTRVRATVQGDTYFPGELCGSGHAQGWREVARVEHPADARHAHAMSFVQLDRV